MLKTASDAWDKGYEHHIMATLPDLGPYAQVLKNAGYIIHHLYHKNPFIHWVYFSIFVRKNQIDIVHMHRESMSLYFCIAAKLGGAKRIVHTVHSAFPFAGILRLRRIFTRNMERLLGVRLVAISQSVQNNEQRKFHVPSSIVNNWYDEHRFCLTSEQIKLTARQALDIDAVMICISSVGNCLPVKNHLSILRALATMKNPNILYIHIGKGDQEAEELAFIHERGIESMVRYVGFQDPLLYLQATDLFIMPSIREGLGMAAVEAMATGLPCLFTLVNGLKDFQGYPNVIHCELSDESIAQALHSIMSNPVSLKNSELLSARIHRQYSIINGVRAYEALYSFHPKGAQQ